MTEATHNYGDTKNDPCTQMFDKRLSETKSEDHKNEIAKQTYEHPVDDCSVAFTDWIKRGCPMDDTIESIEIGEAVDGLFDESPEELERDALQDHIDVPEAELFQLDPHDDNYNELENYGC